MGDRTVPSTVPDDDDDVVVALETARVSEESSDLEAASKWLHRAAAAARRQGRPDRAGMLSRCAAQILNDGKFEKKPNEEQLFREIEEDDFSESTIVETADEIAKKSASVQPVPHPDSIIVDKPTPVAPLTESYQPAESQESIRVAFKKVLGGKFEARPLRPGEKVGAGEQEALLVPTPMSPS